MTSKIKIAIAALIVLGTSITFWQLARDPATPASTPIQSETGSDGGQWSAVVIDDAAVEAPSTDEEEDDRDRAAVSPLGISLSGQVFDNETREPVPLFEIEVQRMRSRQTDSMGSGSGIGTASRIITETVRHKEGRFSIPLEKGGDYGVSFNSPCHTRSRVSQLEVPENSGLSGLEFFLDPGLRVSGRVVDDATGRPVKGALVASARYPRYSNLVSFFILGREAAFPNVTTDEAGCFTLAGLEERDTRITAVHDRYAEGTVETVPGSGENVEIRLEDGFHIFGRALDDTGKPAEKLLILMYGKDFPICRSVLTGREGRYRTPPIRPGKVLLVAKILPRALRDPIPFAEEQKFAELVDRDVEVNFGTPDTFVTWQGTLFGYDGNVMPDATVIAEPTLFEKENAPGFSPTRYLGCNDEGRFETRKLPCGHYKISVQPSMGDRPNLFRQIEWKTLNFDQPGPVQKDIDLSQEATISGVVIDGLTNLPFMDIKGRVRAFETSRNPKYYSVAIEADGTFRLEGVATGNYFIDAMVDDRPICREFGIKIGKGKSIEDLRLVVEAGGMLELRVHGFAKGGDHNFYLSRIDEGEEQDFNYGLHLFNEGGFSSRTFKLKPGLYTVALSFPELGHIQKSFEILPGRTTKVDIRRNEVAFFEGFLTVSGTLRYHDGTPVPGRSLSFSPWSVPGFPGYGHQFDTRTDGEGIFSLGGFKPGHWEVRSRDGFGVDNGFPSIYIPQNATDPYPCHLTLAAGTVTGTLFNRATGDPMPTGPSCRWFIHIQDVARDGYPCYFSGPDGAKAAGAAPGRFRLTGLKAGTYQLRVSARACTPHSTGPFYLADGQALDMGRIDIDPCGSLKLFVDDEEGKQVSFFKVFINGVETRSKLYDIKGEGLYEPLPTGDVELIVREKGFKDHKEKIKLVPGVETEHRVLMIK